METRVIVFRNVEFTEGELWVLDWILGKPHGHFMDSITSALEHADDTNLNRMALSFPSQVQALRDYRSTKGWWGALQEKAREAGYLPALVA